MERTTRRRRMSCAANRLVSRLVAIQLLAWGATGLLVVAFAPRVLLLDGSVTAGSATRAVQAWLAAAGLVVTAALMAGRRARPLLRALVLQEPNIEPQDIHALYAAPSRLVALDLIIALLVGAATLVAPIRPETNDVYTQLELVLLIMTIATLAVLPAYVAMPASVAKVLALVPVAAARDAVDLLGTPQRQPPRLPPRLLPPP